jgi:hypothetical protein
MKSLRIVCLGIAFVVSVLGSARADILADSIADFSGVQGQVASGHQGQWFYGFFNQGTNPNSPYQTSGFMQFDTFTGGSWTASDGQVGQQNNDFLNVNQIGGHPTGLGPPDQDSIIWAVRRYVSPVSGAVDICFDLRKVNVFNDRGGGITGRIFVDGVEVFSQLIQNTDGVGVHQLITQNVNVGSVIDFAIDPTGHPPLVGGDGIFSARADGSHFSAQIATTGTASFCVPEPSRLLLVSVGIVALGFWVRRQKP